jgi:penicillin amidase
MDLGTALRRVSIVPLMLIGLSGCQSETSKPNEIEIIRDRWGIAHVYAESEPALFFGYGHVMAEDRMFQMMLRRRAAEGRLAEILGPGPDDRFIQLDRRNRILGFKQLGERMLDRADPDTRALLEAFAAGVNAYLDSHRGELSPLFEKNGSHPEPWRAADCITLWHWIGDRFMPGWEDEVLAKRGELTRARTGRPLKAEWPRPDDAGQIVSEEEFKRSYPDAYERLRKVPRAAQSASVFQPRPVDFKASQNWVVGPSRSATGKAILQSDPQVWVRNPSFGYEVHLTGGRYNTRGWAIAIGAPGILVGWNEHVAWGATALLGDHADLFEERVNPENSNQYQWRGAWKTFDMRTETIQVKGRGPVTLEVRSTHHGNVVNELLDGVEPGEVYTLTTAATAAETSSMGGTLKMMRATDWASFRAAMSEYASPAPHIIYADAQGNIGYHTLVRTPARPAEERLPREGWSGEDEWSMIPFELMPSMLNPRAAQIYTANQLPAGSWYPYPLGPARGVGPRAQRLAELFSREGKFSVDDFLREVHRDAVNPTLRDFVILALAVMADEPTPDPEVAQALDTLAAWDYQLIVDRPAYAVASGILQALETEGVAEIHAFGYAGTEEGPSYLFRELMPQFERDGKLPDVPGLRAWLKKYLLKGIALAPEFQQDVENGGHVYAMPYQDNWLEMGSFAPEHDLESPPLPVRAIQTIWSPVGQNYAQIVDFSDLDGSQSINPPGISENPSSPHFKDQLDLWAKGEMHPAPLSRAGVEKYRESSSRLAYRPPH